MNAPALEDLPRIKDAHTLPGHAARLTLEDGAARTVSSAQPRLMLCPLPDAPGAVFLEDWKDTARALYVPAHALPAVRAALHLRRVGA